MDENTEVKLTPKGEKEVKKNKYHIITLIITFAVLFCVDTLCVMLAWNVLLSKIFNIPQLSFIDCVYLNSALYLIFCKKSIDKK